VLLLCFLRRFFLFLIALFCDTALNRGICYLQFGDLESALVDFTAVIAVEGENVPGKEWAYHFRGRVYFSREDWSKVIDDNTTAIKVHSRKPCSLSAVNFLFFSYRLIQWY
jgi:hypothetical protein